MKAKALIIIFIVIAVQCTCVLLATGNPINTNTYSAVNFTVHNLMYNPGQADQYNAQGLTDLNRNIAAWNSNATQSCIFCHTPHSAAIAAPLWNKALLNGPAVGAYQLYTSSPSLSQHVKTTSKITPTSESLLCLSCHDGKTAINALHFMSDTSASAGTNSGEYIMDVFDGGGSTRVLSLGDIFPAGIAYTSNIGASRDPNNGIITGSKTGTDLTDDHPIGFTYPDVVSAKPNEFNPVGTAEGRGVRFFGTEKRLECSSCHNPHVYYGYARNGSERVVLNIPGTEDKHRDRFPFLVRDNNGSGLCLACHKK